MKPDFREAKATEMAALLLRLRGGEMSYMKLLKLMYLVDREALIRFGHPVTYDRYVSMDHGPVLSQTKDLMCEGARPGTEPLWSRLISAPHGNYEVSLLPTDYELHHLSEAETALVQEIFDTFGTLSRWDIRDYSHTLPEWQDPEGSAIPITYHDILIGAHVSVDEVHGIEEELSAQAFADMILG